MTISYDHLRRRVQDGLNYGSGSTVSASVYSSMQMPSDLGDRSYSRLDRFKGVIIEKVLPKFGLTSYHNLQRVRGLLENQLNASAIRYNELWKDYHELQTQNNGLRMDYDVLQTQRTNLILENDQMSTKLNEILSENNSLIRKLDELKAQVEHLLHGGL